MLKSLVSKLKRVEIILFRLSLSLPQALESAQFLCKVQGLDSVTELYRQHMGQLLYWLSASVNTWCSYTPQRLQLHIIVMQSGEKWSLNMYKTLPNYTAGAGICRYRDTIMVKEVRSVFWGEKLARQWAVNDEKITTSVISLNMLFGSISAQQVGEIV